MKTFLMCGSVLAIMFVPAAPFFSQEQNTQELKCPGIWYDSASCACDKSAEKCCTCEGCTGGEKCPCLNILKEGTCTIKGVIKSPWFAKIESVVYIKEVKDGKFTLPRKNPIIDQKNLVYVPHVMPLLVGSTIDFPNSDTVRHNVYSTRDSATPFNLGAYPVGQIKRQKFEKVGIVSLLCNVHAEMSAFVVVCQNPYFAAVNIQDGTFTIRNVPAGSYKLTLFHEKQELKEDIEVTVKANEAAEITIESKQLCKKK